MSHLKFKNMLSPNQRRRNMGLRGTKPLQDVRYIHHEQLLLLAKLTGCRDSTSYAEMVQRSPREHQREAEQSFQMMRKLKGGSYAVHHRLKLLQRQFDRKVRDAEIRESFKNA